ncbi:MAG: hypothetical protein HY042_11415 [Spirochaetia bacterium]|nr:hypothetical protein [Spirochaetia bacterium]
MLFDQRLGSGIIYNADGYRHPVYFVGAAIKMIGEGRFAVSHTFFTTCAAQKPHYNFSARRIYIYENEKIVAVGVLFYVGGIPVLPLPFLYASSWGTGIISQAGYGQIQGGFLQNTYQFSVPTALASSWQPIAYRFKLDFYENTGTSSGVDMFRFSPGLNYFLQLGASEFKNYEAEIRDSKVRITNNVQHYVHEKYSGNLYATGRGEELYDWKKIYGVMNWHAENAQTNSVRNVHLRYEDYTNRAYDFEFGGRFQPATTIPALYAHHEAGRGLLHNDTNWNLVYNEMLDDLTVRVEATRNRLWLQKQTIEDSHYIPVNDVVPSVDIAKKINLGRVPVLDIPVYWDNVIHTDTRKDYSNGAYLDTIDTSRGTSSFRSYINPLPYVSFNPIVGIGAQRTTSNVNSTIGDAAALDLESKKRSYEFYFTEDEFMFGPDFLYLRTTYRRKDTVREEQKDAPQLNLHGFNNNQKLNETEVALESNFLRTVSMSLSSIYDMRKFEYPVEYRDRWFYPVFRTDVLFDFLNLFRQDRENLLSRRKAHFLQFRVTNDYVYDAVNHRDHSNVLGLNFQAGGFDLWLLERLRFFETGFYWYHVYHTTNACPAVLDTTTTSFVAGASCTYNNQGIRPDLDQFRYTARADIQITRRVYFEMELESRATNTGRYRQNHQDVNGNNDYTAFSNDVVNGMGFNGPEKRQKSVFNVGYFEMALIMDVHDFEYRVGYSVEQKSVLAVLGSVSTVNFYDNKVFFSIQLLRFDLGGIGDRPSRFLLERQRVRPTDVGRTGIRTN